MRADRAIQNRRVGSRKRRVEQRRTIHRQRTARTVNEAHMEAHSAQNDLLDALGVLARGSEPCFAT